MRNIVTVCWMAVWVVAAGVSAPSAAVAQSASQCQYHSDCESGAVCKEGRCIQRSSLVDQWSAQEACGEDRRCRIERLKRQNQARRRIEKLEDEKKFQRMVDNMTDEELEDYPRIDRPWTFDIRTSRQGVLGLAAGYTFFGQLRTELHYVYWNSYVDVNVDEQFISGSQSIHFLIPGLYYFFLRESEFTPYAATTFMWASGSYNGGFSGGFGGSGNGGVGDFDTEYHALGLQGGIDWQMEDQGAHLRLGLAYRPLLYNQARFGPGNYSDQGRRAMEKWFEQMVRIDVILMGGWSF